MFEQQFLNARDHVLPFVSPHVALQGARVLDVGAGEGGVMKAFAEAEATGIGVDLNPERAEFARGALEQECDAGVLEFVTGDIHDASVTAGWEEQFDLVTLKDAIEHITEKEKLLTRLGSFLRPGGMLFLGFPPWRMPYGGHQQIAASKIGQLPYYHLLPRRLYRKILGWLGEGDATIDELLELCDTGISIAGFESLVVKCGFEVVERRLYLINPIYQYKFGLRPRTQFRLLAAIPGLRDFVTTTCYYVIRPSRGQSDE